MEAAVVTRCHALVTGEDRALGDSPNENDPANENDPEGGIPSGSLEALGGLTKPYVIFIGTKFFRLMLRFVSIVSSAVTFSCPGMGRRTDPIPLKSLA